MKFVLRKRIKKRKKKDKIQKTKDKRREDEK